MHPPSNRQSAVKVAVSNVVLPPGIGIRAWTDEDFPAVQRLSSIEGWPTPDARPKEALAGWQRSWPTLVATERNMVVGFVRALTDGEVTTFIAELLIEARWRGRDIGRALLDACHYLYPHTRQDLLSTEDSDSFYEVVGFRRFTGFRKNYIE